MPLDEAQNNLDLFHDCLSGPLVQRSAVDSAKTSQKRRSKGRKKSIKPVQNESVVNNSDPADAEDLAEFIDV